MTQDEKWLRKYEDVVALVDEQMTLEDVRCLLAFLRFKGGKRLVWHKNCK